MIYLFDRYKERKRERDRDRQEHRDTDRQTEKAYTMGLSGFTTKYGTRVVQVLSEPASLYEYFLFRGQLSLESNIMWVGTILLTPSFLHDCGSCVSVFVSFHQRYFPNSLTLSFLVLFVFHRVLSK